MSRHVLVAEVPQLAWFVGFQPPLLSCRPQYTSGPLFGRECLRTTDLRAGAPKEGFARSLRIQHAHYTGRSKDATTFFHVGCGPHRENELDATVASRYSEQIDSNSALLSLPRFGRSGTFRPDRIAFRVLARGILSS